MDHLLLRDESTDLDFERDVILRILEHDLNTHDRKNDARYMKQVSPEEILNDLNGKGLQEIHPPAIGSHRSTAVVRG